MPCFSAPSVRSFYCDLTHPLSFGVTVILPSSSCFVNPSNTCFTRSFQLSQDVPVSLFFSLYSSHGRNSLPGVYFVLSMCDLVVSTFQNTISYNFFALRTIAQSLERTTSVQEVMGSIPTTGALLLLVGLVSV